MTDRVLPSVFVSHGAPTLAMEKNDTVEFLRRLGAELGRPRAILCVSAHWATRVPTLSAAERPETIHDFGGFPAELYRVRYDAPGAPTLAARAAELLSAAGVASELSNERGLDHGAWVPLSLMYPERDVPVTQLSVQPRAGAAEHFRIGMALAPLRREGVLILSTGGATHNLRQLGHGDEAPDWAARFDEWLDEKIRASAYEDLLDYRRLAPHAELAHPTDEHLLPLFVAAGAGLGEAPGRSLHRGWTHGSLSMAAYAFGGDEENPDLS
ncbi:MAG TPA: class III extradiol ring-cleavage dioxygenase [Pyrinomonadaceae bacterium]|jgi:4,5-DOPA dioxygenase extradiol|nr:class III extradiol ring-cleavage dioxygenase [Pyrinomonadaceae bacterium]